MSLDLFKKMINDIKMLGRVSLLRYCGTGESLLNKHFLEMTRYAYEAKVADRYELVTNGFLINNKSSILLPRYLDRIIISVEGLDDQDYITYAGAKVNIHEMIEKFTVLFNNRKECIIHIKTHNHAVEGEGRLEKFYQMFGSICDEIYVENLVQLWPETDSNLGVEAGFRFGGGNAKSRKVCPQPFKSMQVQANGEVVPCCIDWKRVNVIGDITKMSLREIWDGDLMRSLRLKHLGGQKDITLPCADCTMNDYSDPDDIDDFVEEILARVTR